MKFDLELKGSSEFYKNLNNKIYYILKVDNKEKEKYMINFFNKFIGNQMLNLNEKHYIGIDFEFNKISKGDRDIALMQINMEQDNNTGYIFVLYPPELSSKNLSILINLLTNKYIIKILHGSESLDIPYLFNQLLITKKNIDNFCSNFYDTKYLCEYKNTSKSCSIYNLLLDNQIITQTKVKELDSIGPVYLEYMDIHNLSNDILRYSLYDVIYLPELLKKYLIKGKIYSKIIPETSHIVFKYKRGIELEFIQLEKLINSLNVYFIYDNDNIILLNDIWLFYYNIIYNKYLDNLKEIHYFKNFIEITTKLAVYSYLMKYYRVYQNKNNSEIINFDKYFLWLKKYPHFNNIFLNFNIQIK